MSILQTTIGKEFGQYGISAEAFRIGMLNVIRQQAKQTKVVGDEIMTVTIMAPPGGWEVTWTFESPRNRYGAVTNGKGEVQRVFRSYFSPWIISPSSITKPSFGNGHFEHTIGNVKIRCGNQMDGQGTAGGAFFAVSSQDRTAAK